MIIRKYTYKFIKKDLEKFKEIQREASEIYLAHVDCEFEYFQHEDEPEKITEIIRFKTYEDFLKAEKIEDPKIETLLNAMKSLVDFDSLYAETLIPFRIDK